MNDYISFVSTDDFLTVFNLKTSEVLIVSRDEIGDEAFEQATEIVTDPTYPPDERFQAAYNALYSFRSKVEEAGLSITNEDTPRAFWGDIEIPADMLQVMHKKRGMDKHRWQRFFTHLAENPSYKVFTQLAKFIMSCPGITLDDDGYVLAYKGVRNDYYDVHSETNLNMPGTKHSMPRNKVEDDPEKPCGQGLHLGSLSYATNWGARVMVCRVNPKDVVSVPYDHDHQKLRCCEYEVLHEVKQSDSEDEE